MWVGQRCALWTWMRAPAHARIPAQQRRAARHARRLLILRKHHTRTAARTRSCVRVYVCTCVCARARSCACACVCVRLRASACVHACTHACMQARRNVGAWVRACAVGRVGEWVCACICTVDNRGLDPQIECDHRLFKCTCAQSPAQIFHGSMHTRAPTEMKRPARPIH